MITECIRQGIDRGRVFVISTHVNPDADGFGSAVALAWMLEHMGRRAFIVNREHLPAAFRFIEAVHPVSAELPAGAESADTWVVLDSSRRERTGFLPPAGVTVINIDHHPDNQFFGDCNWVEPNAAATAVLIFQLIRSYGLFPNPAVADALYTGILVDTGGFKFSNTNAGVFSVCAELAAHGVDCQRIYNLAFMNKTLSRVRLEGLLMSRAELLENNRVCLMAVTDEVLNKSKATRNDLEGISNLTMCLDGVEAGVMLIAQQDGTKVNLRSDGRWNVGEIATHFGGGGHAAAAGCTLAYDISVTRDKVMAAVHSMLTPQLSGATV